MSKIQGRHPCFIVQWLKVRIMRKRNGDGDENYLYLEHKAVKVVKIMGQFLHLELKETKVCQKSRRFTT